ncbi:MAG: STAS domain-containing protein [Candidatus Hinthialibacter antarcticus]|nr:STAS domain-containing protein [Candidatus Hinthialibacter antarcticus]
MWKKFDLTTTEEQNSDVSMQIVNVKGYLDSSTFQDLQDHLHKLIDDGKSRVVVEFGELNYISSAGLGVLMGMLQEARENGGDLKLANMSTKVRNLFDMLGFSRLIRIYEDVDSAKQAFVDDANAGGKAETTPMEDNY